jgi:hypothetical protein
MILDEAMKRNDAPQPPNNLIAFSQKEFREAFKIYYDLIYVRVKQMRKIPHN